MKASGEGRQRSDGDHGGDRVDPVARSIPRHRGRYCTEAGANER